MIFQLADHTVTAAQRGASWNFETADAAGNVISNVTKPRSEAGPMLDSLSDAEGSAYLRGFLAGAQR